MANRGELSINVYNSAGIADLNLLATNLNGFTLNRANGINDGGLIFGERTIGRLRKS